MSQHELGAGSMHPRLELETAAFGWLVDGPAGKDFGNLGYIALRVAAIHAQRVQFQQFASIIFIEAAGTLALIRTRRTRWIVAPIPAVRTRRKPHSPRRVRSYTHPIVQVEQ